MSRFRTIATVLMLVAVTVGPVGPASAAPRKPVITVPAGDVAALYAAVYDGAASRPGVVIWLEEGRFDLDPAMGPHSGRLVLGANTELRGSMVLDLDDNDVPTGVVAQPGAVLDTNLIFGATPIDPGVVTLGPGGTVAGIAMTSSTFALPALDIPDSGLIEQVLVEGHFEGARLFARADQTTTTGTIRQTVMRSNGFPGIAVIQADPLLPVADSTVRLTAERNLIVSNGTGFLIYGGTTGSQNTRTVVHASDNVISDNGTGYLIWGASDANMENSGANDNSTRLISRNDTISGSDVGVVAEGATRLCSPIAGGCFFDETSLSNRNSVKVNLNNTSFANSAFVDVLADGVYSDDFGNDGDPVGEDNTVKVILANTSPNPGDLGTLETDCFPVVDPCLNEAKILPTGG